MTAIILAAGFSQRFGGQKLMEKINGMPMIRRVADAVRALGFKRVVLVYRQRRVKRAAKDRGITYARNAAAAEGIGSSVRCGVKAAGADDAYIFFMGDQPFVCGETVQRLRGAFEKGLGSIVVPRYAGRAGNPVVFGAEWRPALQNLKGDAGGRTLIRENADKVCYIDVPDAAAGMDVDTREDLRSILAR